MGRTLAAELAREPGPTLFLEARSAACARPSEIIGRELGLDPADGATIRAWPSSAMASGRGSAGRRSRSRIPRRWPTGAPIPHGFSPPGGETHFDLRRRSAAVLADIVASATRTVVVGHGVSGAVMRGINLGLDAKAMFVLEKPQDAFFRLLAGVEERIACEAVVAAQD